MYAHSALTFDIFMYFETIIESREKLRYYLEIIAESLVLAILKHFFAANK